jgi:sulfate adenylyltransferase (ADP) / ATP adenylyltransferase
MPQRNANARETLMLEPGTLWAKVTERTEHALRCGALQPIPTDCEFVEQGGVNFLVRVLHTLARKDEAKKKQEKESASSGTEFNPFLPYDEDLFVTDISDTHLCLLNKFNVIDHHLLIVTRAFEEQETLLNLQDFEAMWACLAEIDGLAFYNGGKLAGASQRHKHLQLVPLPLVPDGPNVPIEPLLATASFQGSVGTIPSFPFVHAIAKFDPNWIQSPLKAASSTLECYHALLQAVGLNPAIQESDSQQSGAYNLLATRQWMLLVPRSSEDFQSISVNSLGFAGTLGVRNEQQMKILVEQGPMTVLRNVGVSTESQC